MLNSGDVLHLDLGSPTGREAGFVHPAVVVTAQAVLNGEPAVIHVVPMTSTIRDFGSEVLVARDRGNRLKEDSAAQCQHIRAVSRDRVVAVRGNVGPLVLQQIREIIGLLLDVPIPL